VNPAGLGGGIYSASVVITGGGSGAPTTLPVTLIVSGAAQAFTVNPSSVSFNAQTGGTSPGPQYVVLTTPSAANYTASASSTGGWLAVNPTSGATTVSGSTNSATLTLSANTSGLTAGTYSGTVTVTVNNSNVQVPVTLTVGTSSVTATVSPTTLSFTAQPGGAAPPSQAVTVTTSPAGTLVSAVATMNTGSNWLTVSPASATSGSFSVAVNPANLGAGSYTGLVTLTPSGGASQTVAISLTVSQSALTVSTTPITFSYQTDGPAPAAKTLAVNSTGAAIAFTATASSTGGWLTVTPASGTTPANLTIGVNPAGLTAGTLNGSVNISSSATAGGTVTVPVSITVTTPLPTITRVLNAASYGGGAVAPGEIVTLQGTAIGPNDLVTLRLDSGRVATTLSDIRVLFNGVPAPLIYVSAVQTSVVVPYEIAGRTDTTVILQNHGVSSNGVNLPVATTAPGIFTLNASGTGPGAILNQDTSVNSPNNPATKGTIVSIYATGEGATTPTGVNGAVTGSNPPLPVLPVTVTIGGQSAEVLFAGEAPGIVSGVIQVNARIPAGVASGDLPVVIMTGNRMSQAGVTVSVR
jgi:uncharacterized protein (TIGR03437 family)